MKILTIVGARPQFVKAAMVSRAIRRHCVSHPDTPVVEEILHTGQHYDASMSESFFTQMSIPSPVANLNVGSGLHGAMTARMLEGIEREILARQPSCVLVYGDTNSTLAGALAAAKVHVPIVHVEAGLRSFNKRMPEEINRVLPDHLSSLLFCPTHTAVENLAREGISRSVHLVGDVMYDAARAFGEVAERESTILPDLCLTPRSYLLATVHRAENTNDPAVLQSILAGLAGLDEVVVFPLHPRTRTRVDMLPGKPAIGNVKFVEPVAFLDMLQLERHARCILTDSGGVQKEAYFHGVPCVTLRHETEWVETVTAGWNQLVGTDAEQIIAAVHRSRTGVPIAEYGQGNCAEDILALMFTALASQQATS